jgi:hypothetical protein
MNGDESAPAEFEGMLKHVDRDLELDFIREFATGGELLKALNVDMRRERILWLSIPKSCRICFFATVR